MSARRYRYTGKERDDETGLYYNGARYLAAWLGRWTSADPIGIGADGPGLYNYTRGSPVNYTDPSGTESTAEMEAQLQASRTADETAYNIGQIGQIAAYEASKSTGASSSSPGADFEFPEIDQLETVQHPDERFPGVTGQARQNMITNYYEKIAWKVQQDRENSVSGYLAGVASKFPQFTLLEVAQEPSKAGDVGKGIVMSLFAPMQQAQADQIMRLAQGNGTAFEYGEATSPIFQVALGAATKSVVAEAPIPDKTPFSGTRYDFKHVAKHIEGSEASLKLIEKGDAAHVFRDVETFAAATEAVMKEGTFTGTRRTGAVTTERFGVRFEEAIGTRIAPDGSRIPLFYAEATVSASGFFHVMPRSGPSTWSSKWNNRVK